jgi:hypothetical protein
MPIPPSADISVKLQSLSDQLDQSEHAKEKEIALVKFLQDLEVDKGYTILKPLPSGFGTSDGNGRGENREPTTFADIIGKHNLGQAYLNWTFTDLQPTDADSKPLERLPCANVKPEENWRCRNDGKLTCAECHLVSYCSKVCSHRCYSPYVL